MHWLMIGAGGALGAFVRYAVFLVFGGNGKFFLATLVVNILGHAAFVVLFVIIDDRALILKSAKVFLRIGF
ncbi:MAG: hypothetical protein OSA42_05820 [Porticoccaceae bacterium]|nr:hypothetical protein [Porticoccaceae bacterium]